MDPIIRMPFKLFSSNPVRHDQAKSGTLLSVIYGSVIHK
jgi:hypothetical protein